ncbi:MAG: pyrroline-5-carboxylate reductase [Armatimonadota bacterium]
MGNQKSFNLAVIGAGAMGSGIITSLVDAGALETDSIIAADIDDQKLQQLADSTGVSTTTDNISAIEQAEMVLLAVKPQVLPGVLEGISGAVADRCVVSIAAGVPIATYEEAFGTDTSIIRVMPNILCTVGEAASAYAPNEACCDEEIAEVDRLLNAVGTAVCVEEKLLDAVTGLSGSGPAFAAIFIGALIDGGVAAGLTRSDAAKLATQTVLGAAKWITQNDYSPADLKALVTSPGGTTIAGVCKLEEKGLRSAAIEAVIAAAERSRELGS